MRNNGGRDTIVDAVGSAAIRLQQGRSNDFRY